MAALYKMLSCQGGLNWIYGECTVKNVICQGGLIWLDMDMEQIGLSCVMSSGTYTYYPQASPSNPRPTFLILQIIWIWQMSFIQIPTVIKK